MTAFAPAQTLTFLFTDIEGSTPLWDRDPEAMRAATAKHNALLREAIATRGGQAFRVVGDAFCVAFVDAASAVLAAIDAQRASARLGFHENTAAAMWLAGRSHEAKGDRDGARRAYFEGLREIAQSTSRAGLPRLLEAVGGLHPNAPAAPRLLGLAAALLESSNTPVFPAERADVERWRAAVRAAHDPLVFDRQFTAGRTSRHEDAIADALALEAST